MQVSALCFLLQDRTRSQKAAGATSVNTGWSEVWFTSFPAPAHGSPKFPQRHNFYLLQSPKIQLLNWQTLTKKQKNKGTGKRIRHTFVRAANLLSVQPSFSGFSNAFWELILQEKLSPRKAYPAVFWSSSSSLVSPHVVNSLSVWHSLCVLICMVRVSSAKGLSWILSSFVCLSFRAYLVADRMWENIAVKKLLLSSTRP